MNSGLSPQEPVRLLQFAPCSIALPTTGAELRNYHLARQMARKMWVSYVGFRSGDPLPAGIEAPACQETTFVEKDRRYTLGKLLRGFAGPAPISVLNYASPAMAEALSAQLAARRFDIVQMESLHMAGYLPLIRAARNRPRAIICDWHNIESELMRRYSENTSHLPRKVYAWRTAHLLEALERKLLRECDAHLVVSDRERERLLALSDGEAQVYVIENGVDTAYFSDEALDAPGQRRRVLFVGSMDYHANADAAVDFARNVWPSLRQRLPAAVFTIAGRDPTPAVRALASEPGIEVTGTVPDVRPYYREAIATVVPLRVGGGTRLKILEAMAAGVPVVSSAIGAEGLRAEAQVHYLRADTAGEFSSAVCEIGSHDFLRRRLAAAGRALVREQYDWSSIGDALVQVHMALAGRVQHQAAAAG